VEPRYTKWGKQKRELAKNKMGIEKWSESIQGAPEDRVVLG